MHNVILEFKGTQIGVSTNAQEVVDYLRVSHRALIVASARDLVGEIRVLQSEQAFECVASDALEHMLEPADLFDWLARQILDHFIRSHADLLWLHSACVTKDGRAFLLAGPAAQGKSTLSAALGKSGWNYFSDEVAPVRMSEDRVLPYARAPRPRIHPSNQVAASDAYELPRQLLSMEAKSADADALITWIVFLKFRFGAPTNLVRVTAGEAAIELVRNCFNFFDHRAEAVERIGKLALTTRCYVMEYGDSADATLELSAIADY